MEAKHKEVRIAALRVNDRDNKQYDTGQQVYSMMHECYLNTKYDFMTQCTNFMTQYTIFMMLYTIFMMRLIYFMTQCMYVMTQSVNS